VILAIIGYLIYIKNKKSATDNIKIKDELLKKVISGLYRKKVAKEKSMQSFGKESKN